ncbi:Putative AMP-dependent synthetase/ligase, ANL domain, AMP-binding enzyme domain superfamily [Septoria linicola]|uniref:AMP-dependent synthetase/ligase, ANL domain, AMP-binding enzyme domain superfamily n=1 Tax=Septoria linicola TaxID=215465 RepID=A0A9Q9EJR8_9PEZI|nr:putative AMP-dependent synthetase/ligase, ANL domain, AMP-binding enzyme domain superfamily [Septoria linicola]USW52499.1 Putative AMP-dependent synthetase/ligase, ANL domain, AMP-binding enzyme domain superfamily [Septoria linicola]
MAPAEICNPPIPIPKTLWHSFEATVANRPEEIAYTVCYQPADHLSWLVPPDNAARARHLNWTYSQLKDATVRIAARFLEQGVQRGSTLVTFLPNGIERELLTWVSVALQLTLMPLDPALFEPGRKAELEHYITSVTPHVVVVRNAEAASEWDKCSANSEALKLSLEPISRPEWIGLEALSANQYDQATAEALVAQQDLAIENDNERIAAILYTSGTSSGKPKGCAIASRQFLTVAHSRPIGGGPFKSMAIYSTNFRSMSNMLAYKNIQTGVRCVLPSPTVNIEKLLDAIEECAVEAALFMPYMLYGMASDTKFASGRRDLSSMRFVILGGDVITTDMVARAKKIFPHAIVEGAHAMSEAVGCMIMAPPKDGRPATFGNIMCAGTANTAASIKICDEGRNVLERGQLGELHLGGPMVIRGYWRNVQPELFYEDEKTHWILTGDRALMDEEGRVFVVGRSKDIIKKKGMTFSPAVISSTLNRHPGIVATAFGIPHEINGEATVAVVENTDPPNSREHIMAIVTDSLGIDYALDELYTLADVGMDKFPIGATGKVMNLTLKQAVLKLKERRESAATSNRNC